MGKIKKLIFKGGTGKGAPNEAFITTWKTDVGGPVDTAIKLPLLSQGNYDMIVDWGDGTQSDITAYNQAEVTHTYAAHGTYTVTITGTLYRWAFYGGGYCEKLIAIDNWGCWTHNSSGIGASNFEGCSNLVTIKDANINLEDVTSIDSMFKGCTSLVVFPEFDFTGVITANNTWENCTSLVDFQSTDFGTVQTLNSTFKGCTSLVNMPSLTLTVVRELNNTWENCTALQNVDIMQTSDKLVELFRTFFSCSSLLSMDISDTYNVTDWERTFQSCTNLLACELDLSGATDMGPYTWFGCSSLVFTPINLASYTSSFNPWENCKIMDPSVLSQILINIDNNNPNSGKSIDFSDNKYDNSGVAAYDSLILKGWTINSGGLA